MATQVREDAAILGFEAKWADVDGINTRYYEVGEQNEEVMVLVHGALFDGIVSANTWTLNLEGLGKKYHVYALDKLGSGLTDNPKSIEEYTQHHIVQHLHRFIDVMGIKQFHMAGQSNGGYTVARLVMEMPGMCKSLIISDSGTLGPAVGDMQERRRTMYEDMPVDSREALIQRWTRLDYTTDDLTDEYVDTALYLGGTPKALQTKKDVEAGGRDANQSRFPADKAETLRWIEEGRLDMPVLLTWGFNDPSAIVEVGHSLFAMLSKGTPHAEMHIFNQAGHFHFRERPDDYNGVVIDFITRTAGR